MHVMVVTRRTQGQRDTDYMWAVPGELAFLPIVECEWDTQAGFNHGARYFLGLESGGATTTAEVIAMDVTAQDITAYVVEKLATVGWTASARNREALRLVTEMLSIAACFPPGSIIEKRGRDIRQRPSAEIPSPPRELLSVDDPLKQVDR
jgi:hypothetical protein